MFTSTLANWDGRLSGSATGEAQPARGSTSASTVSTTPAVLDSTSSSAAASSTDFNSPYAFTNGKQRTDKKVSGDVTLVSTRFCPIFFAVCSDPYLELRGIDVRFVSYSSTGNNNLLLADFQPNPPTTKKIRSFK
jgi:hypothetical protein